MISATPYLICDLQRAERLVGDATSEGDLTAAEGATTAPRQLQLDVLLDAEERLQDVEARVPEGSERTIHSIIRFANSSHNSPC